MRLNKTGYLFFEGGFLKDEQGNIVRDKFGDPVRIPPTPNIPFKFKWEPFSPELAKTTYGISTIDIRYRLFTKTDDRLATNVEFVYDGYKYKIQYPLKFDNHYEILVSQSGEYNT